MDRVTIYDVSGGEPVALTLWAVDALEALANDPGRYVKSLDAAPAAADAGDDADGDDEGDEAEGDADADAPSDAPAPRKRGRPRKVPE